MPPFDLSGRVALVTGAGRGLGFAMAHALALAGACVVLNGRDQAALSAAVDRIAADGGMAAISVFDVADHNAGATAIAAIISAHGALDILVNNVGHRDRGRDLFDVTANGARALIETNLLAPFHLARAAARPMMAAGRGRIINITSIAGPIANQGDAVYTMAKGGLAALTRALAAEFGQDGITVNGIAPGFFATEANAALVADQDLTDWLAKRSALGRWGQPHEIGGAAVFLASDAASFITGEILTVDGGYLSHF